MILQNNTSKILSINIKRKILPLIMGTILCTETYASNPTYTMSTVVGTGDYDPTAANNHFQTTTFADVTNPAPRWDKVMLAHPTSVVKDPTDNSIIFADSDHSAIRRVDATGNVSTILAGFGDTPPKFLTIDPTTGDI